MSKVIGRPSAVEPSSLPSGAADRSTKSPTISALVNLPFIPGSIGPEASASTEWTGTIAPAPHMPPREPKPPSRTWS
jgi:hypothetical protein